MAQAHRTCRHPDARALSVSAKLTLEVHHYISCSSLATAGPECFILHSPNEELSLPCHSTHTAFPSLGWETNWMGMESEERDGIGGMRRGSLGSFMPTLISVRFIPIPVSLNSISSHAVSCSYLSCIRSLYSIHPAHSALFSLLPRKHQAMFLVLAWQHWSSACLHRASILLEETNSNRLLGSGLQQGQQEMGRH